MLSTTPRTLVQILLAVLLGLAPTAATAENGYELWLRYRPLEPGLRAVYAKQATSIVELSHGPTIEAADMELRHGLGGLLAHRPESRLRDGAIFLLSGPSPIVPAAEEPTADEGYCLTTTRVEGHEATLISGMHDIGVLYGAFAFLRLMQTHSLPRHLHICDRPRIALRTLDHWDNLDGTIERGYAGPSLWKWNALPAIDRRLIDYARANASIGINGVVLNNVNADARILKSDYIRKVAALARAWRPFGIRVYLSARFSAPIELGGLKSADPLDPQVGAWWRSKVEEIYRLIPDFGGFLVKANAEGQPGPETYGRSHADGANMLADALAPNRGVVLWRAFVYSGKNDQDRAKQAYDDFRPLDGRFRPNVIVQVKNGPIDFQPREPFHPLFGAMPHTKLAMEVEITKEYLGESTALVYLGTMWSETLSSGTSSPTRGPQVWNSLSAIAGVANIGSDPNWTGSDFDQANWYAFGRLAWNPSADPRRIAEEWTRMTWSNNKGVVQPVVAMMMTSREAAVDYMTPLGLAHQMASDHHYGPGPWIDDQPAPLWNPTYYNRADSLGIGFDRSSNGSGAAAQYAPQVARCFSDLRCIPDQYLLWFHHLPWTHRMRSGRTLWNELVLHYDRGLEQVKVMNRGWSSLAPMVDMERHRSTTAKLRRQLQEARWWRDASVAYFRSVSNLPLPRGTDPPRHELSWYKAIHFDTVPGYLTPGTGRQLSCVPPAGGPPCAL